MMSDVAPDCSMEMLRFSRKENCRIRADDTANSERMLFALMILSVGLGGLQQDL